MMKLAVSIPYTGSDYSNVGDPRGILLDSRIRDLKLPLTGVKNYANTHPLVILIDHFISKQCCHQCRNALLAVNEDAFSGG